jgi:hypothetical protein
MVEIAFGATVGSSFKARVLKLCGNIGCDPSFLMAAMAFETGEKFTADVENPSTGATGLIQFLPSTAKQLGTSTAALAEMTAVDQLDWVERYFKPYKGKLKSLSDVYMAILWPKAVGKAEASVIFEAPSKAYKQNKGLDANHDGAVTKGEAAARVQNKLTRGLTTGFRG